VEREKKEEKITGRDQGGLPSIGRRKAGLERMGRGAILKGTGRGGKSSCRERKPRKDDGGPMKRSLNKVEPKRREGRVRHTNEKEGCLKEKRVEKECFPNDTQRALGGFAKEGAFPQTG